MYWRLYWRYLHWFSINYPENPNNNDKQQIKDLIEIMQISGLTCSICRNHFVQWVKKNNINKVVENRKNLFTFFWECHNEVNNRKGIEKMSYELAYELYSKNNWNDILNKYINILLLFQNNKLKEFPNLYNNFWRNISSTGINGIEQFEREHEREQREQREQREREQREKEQHEKEQREKEQKDEFERKQREKDEFERKQLEIDEFERKQLEKDELQKKQRKRDESQKKRYFLWKKYVLWRKRNF